MGSFCSTKLSNRNGSLFLLLLGCEIVPADVDRRDGFIASLSGLGVQKKLYNETMAEMGKYVTVPSYLAIKA